MLDLEPRAGFPLRPENWPTPEAFEEARKWLLESGNGAMVGDQLFMLPLGATPGHLELLALLEKAKAR